MKDRKSKTSTTEDLIQRDDNTDGYNQTNKS